jgi:sugar lactone lactonase YvrE
MAITEATEDSNYSYCVKASDSDSNDTLTYSVKSGTTLPSWLSLGSSSNEPMTIASGMNNPSGIAIDSGGNIYVAEINGTSIHKIDANNNLSSFATINSSNKYALLVVDDHLYVCHFSLRKVSRIALGDPGAGESDWVTGLPSSGPLAMTEKDGDLYIATYANDVVKKINMTTNAITDYCTPDNPFGLNFTSNGNLLIASYNNKRLDRYDGTTLSTGHYTSSHKISDVKVDSYNNIYLCTNGSGIVKLNPDFTFSANIGSDTDTIWSMSIDSNDSLAWGSKSTGNIYKLESGALLSGSPSNDDVGTHDVSLSVSDGIHVTDHIFQITVSNTNDLPVLSSGGNLAYIENHSTALDSSINLSDTDADAVVLGANITLSSNHFAAEDNLGFLSANGITSSWDVSSGTLTLSGNSSLPSYQSALRSVTYSNASDAPSGNTRIVTWQCYDGFDASANVTSEISITAVNDAPTITSSANTNAVAGSPYHHQPTATDAEGDSLSWSLSSGPSGMSVNTITGELTWPPTLGTHNQNENVVLSVSDGSLSSNQSFTIVSTGLNPAPAIAYRTLSGAYGTTAVLSGGNLWSKGRNTEKQLARYGEGKLNRVAAFGDNLIALAMGEGHGLALEGSGNLWSWGSGGFGQAAGLPSLETSLVHPVVQIAAGGHSSYALDDQGDLWAKGRNHLGQGAVGHNHDLTSWTQVPLPSGEVWDMSAGLDHLLLVIDGKLFGSGSNGFGQLGQPSSNTLVLIDGSRTYTRVEAGSFHSLALSDIGEVAVWGRNSEGQLGLGISSPMEPLQLISGFSGVVDLAAGRNHSLIVDATSEVFGAGRGHEQQLPTGLHLNFTPISGWIGVQALDASPYASMVRKSDASVEVRGLIGSKRKGTSLLNFP